MVSEYQGKASVDELSKYDMHPKSIKFIIRVYNKCKNWLRKTGSGDSSILTKSYKLTIINSVRQNPFMITWEMAFQLVHPISKDTIRRYLKNTG